MKYKKILQSLLNSQPLPPNIHQKIKQVKRKANAKLFTTLLIFILFSAPTIATCQNYTQIDGNYIPDVNGTIHLCDQTDLNALQTDLNQALWDYNTIRDQNTQEQIRLGILSTKTELSNKMATLENKIAENLTKINEAKAKAEETSTKIDTTKTDLLNEIAANQTNTIQQLLENTTPLKTETTQIKQAVEELATKQETDKQAIQNTITENKGIKLEEALAITSIIAAIIIVWLYFATKPKKTKPKQENPPQPTHEELPPLQPPYALKPIYHPQQNEEELDPPHERTKPMPTIEKKQGDKYEQLLNDLETEQQSLTYKPKKTFKKKPTKQSPPKEESVPKTQQEINKEIKKMETEET